MSEIQPDRDFIRVGPSSIEGRGVFAKRMIPRGTRIIGASDGNDARFINHGCDPNCEIYMFGDRVLFTGKKGVISHVALYAGNNQILHSSSSGHGVRYDDLSTKRGRYYVNHFVRARRVTENGRSLVQSLALLKEYPFDHYDPPDNAPPARR